MCVSLILDADVPAAPPCVLGMLVLLGAAVSKPDRRPLRICDGY